MTESLFLESWRYETLWWCCCSVAKSCPTLVTPWTAASHAFLSFTVCWSLLKLMFTELVMPSNHLILCHPLLFLPLIFPSIRVSFPKSQLYASGGQSIGVSASASVLPKNIQDWFSLGWTGWISLQSKGLSRSLLQHHKSKASIDSSMLSFLYSPMHIHTWLLEKS